MKLVRKQYRSTAEKRKDFAIGVGVFLGLNILILLLVYVLYQAGSDLLLPANTDVTPVFIIVANILLTLAFLINIGLLIIFILTRTYIGLGMLGAFAGLLVLAIFAGIVFSIVCFFSLGSL